MNDLTVKDLGPLSFNVPIVNKAGHPSPEFQRRWESQRQNNSLIGTGGALVSMNETNNFITSSSFNCYFLDTSGGSYTVFMNPNPAQNEFVEVFDSTGYAGTNPVSFNGNGHNISGSATVSNFININFGHARLVFTGTQWLMQ